MKADKEQLGIEFWERMKPVIGDTPYAWELKIVSQKAHSKVLMKERQNH